MVTPDEIAVELGQPTPVEEPTLSRYQQWIDRTVRQIHRHAERLGVEPMELDSATVDDVVLLAVAKHARNPEGVDSYDVSIDDGRESRRYRHSKGEIEITDKWWSWLFPDMQTGAFSTQTYGEPDEFAHRYPSPVGPWW